ncbi:MAG TPA: hypothetical protein VM733_03325, partial [Thermoanaerobaculia bacterium]|nr:hypothetical protein [Thermoanaerobaculia bacterium]
NIERFLADLLPVAGCCVQGDASPATSNGAIMNIERLLADLLPVAGCCVQGAASPATSNTVQS